MSTYDKSEDGDATLCTRAVIMLSSLASNNEKVLKYLQENYSERMVSSLVHLCDFLALEKSHQSIAFILYFILQLMCSHKRFRETIFCEKMVKGSRNDFVARMGRRYQEASGRMYSVDVY